MVSEAFVMPKKLRRPPLIVKDQTLLASLVHFILLSATPQATGTYLQLLLDVLSEVMAPICTNISPVVFMIPLFPFVASAKMVIEFVVSVINAGVVRSNCACADTAAIKQHSSTKILINKR